MSPETDVAETRPPAAVYHQVTRHGLVGLVAEQSVSVDVGADGLDVDARAARSVTSNRWSRGGRTRASPALSSISMSSEAFGRGGRSAGAVSRRGHVPARYDYDLVAVNAAQADVARKRCSG